MEWSRRSSAEWKVSGRTALSLWLTPFVILGIAAGLRLFARPLWRAIIAEEGPLEWFQFSLLVAAAVVCGLTAWELTRRRASRSAALFLLLALGLAFVAGEEIAWGQLVLGFETPTSLAEANYKAEATLHNVSALVQAFDLGKLAVGLYGLLGAAFISRMRGGDDNRRTTLDLFVIPTFLSSAFLIVVAYRLARFTPLGRELPVGSGELEEVCLYFAALAFAILAWRRVRGSARALTGDGAA